MKVVWLSHLLNNKHLCYNNAYNIKIEHYKNNAFGRVCCDIASIRNVSDRGCFCQLGIGKIKEIGRQANHNDIYINKLSNKKNPSYAGIFKTSNNLKLLVKLAVEATLSIKDE